ncbi:hypothetical protein GCM10023144_26170 [Pigmentiphaga soli]|uniref:Translocation and assembly module TamB C-terminal domain-containing protein n=1 Tax=Pigmentiphaga soli TaxID=1007095 RepID=A0ABP8H4A5_9BURK
MDSRRTDPPSPAAVRPARRRRRWLWLLPLLVVVVAVAAVAAAAWVAATPSGTAWALRTGLALAGAGSGAEGVRGTLADGLEIDRLTVRTPGADVDGERLRVEVAWSALWGRRLHVLDLSAGRLRVDVRPSDDAGGGPPASLGLPLEIDVDRLAIGTLDIATGGTPLPVALSGIDLRAALGPQGHRLLINGLHAAGPQAEASARGELRLGAASPFPVGLDLSLDGRQADRAFALQAEGSGSLEDLALQLRGDGAGVGLDARARLAPLAGFPLRTLQLRLRGIDPSAWASGAPHARLDLTADLGTVDQANAPGAAGAGQVLHGTFALSNADPLPIDRGGVPVARVAGTLDLPADTRVDRVDVSSLDIMAAGGGRLRGDLAWSRPDPADPVGTLQGRLTATDIDASRLHGAAVATRLSGPIAFTADAGSQQVDAKLSEAGRELPLSLALSARLQDQRLTVSRADLEAGPARAHATGELALDGDRDFSAQLRLDRFDPARLAPGAGLPPASLSASATARGRLSPAPAGSVALSVDPGSRWNREPLGGKVDLAFAGDRVERIDAALTAGDSRLRADGAFGRPGDRLRFDLAAPRLEALWPGLAGRLDAKGELGGTPAAPSMAATIDAGDLAAPGGIKVGSVRGTIDVGMAGGAAGGAAGATARGRPGSAPAGLAQAPVEVDLTIGDVSVSAAPQAVMREARVRADGTMASHRATVDAEFVPADGSTHATLAVAVAGGWTGAAGRQPAGWHGTLEKFDASRPPFGIALDAPMTVSLVPAAPSPAWQWEAGAARFTARLPEGRTGSLVHDGSRGGAQGWETRGRAEGLAWAPDLLHDVVAGAKPPPDSVLLFDGDWDLAFRGALRGTAQLRRHGGDLWLPGTPPAPLGLRTAALTLRATPTGAAGRSRVTVQGEIDGERVGRVRIDGEAGVAADGGALGLDPDAPAFADADIDMRDISWAELFAGDANEIGGRIAGKAHVERRGGQWHATGAITGDGLRMVRIDDGVRLLDGTLKATLEDDRLVLDSLRFPSVIRVRPRDSRVVAWLDGSGQGGRLEMTADWRLSAGAGHATVNADRFPLIQRADRFVAGSGRIDMDLAPGKMRIAGQLEADAGWIDLGTEAPATLSSDVYVAQPGDDAPRAKPLGIDIDVGARLGNRFYLRGYGLDTQLTGQLRVTGSGGELMAAGRVSTRGGRFDAYGQTLTVRRGVITFQGPIDDPLLDIVALRVGPQVEAGVQVSGTARHPRIALISEPEVSDVEKLSWLLLGRGPDEGGGSADATLLLGAATSLLGSGDSEPLSRRLGVDEIGVRSGNVGSTRGLLPERTVAGSSTTSTTQQASQFFIIGKRLSNAVYVSFEQALSGRDGVVRASYQLTRRLSVVAKGGTLTGLDLLYYVFFDD